MNVRSVSILLISVFSISFFSSCVSHKLDIVAVSDEIPSLEKIVLEDIVLESVFSYSETKEELKTVIITAAKENKITIIDNLETADYLPRIKIHFREQGYVKGFKNYLSLAVIANVYDSNGKDFYKITYFQDGEESFDSLKNVRDILYYIFSKFKSEVKKSKNND